MAWELQRHMHVAIEPSIRAYLDREDDPEKELARLWADSLWDDEDCEKGYDELVAEAYESMSHGINDMIERLRDRVIEISTTTNGGWEFYADPGGWNTIPWADEEEVG